MRQIELLQFALDALDRNQIPYAIVGSYASGVWGEPRMTLDIDIAVLLEPRHADDIIEAFPREDFYVNRTAVQSAIRDAGQFNVIHLASGNKIDFMVVERSETTPPEIARRRLLQILPNCEAYFASPEDVIIGKLKYYLLGGSEKHLRDIAGILKRSRQAVDEQYVTEWTASHGASDPWRRALDLSQPAE
jgi:hypothetical protein